MAQIGDRVGVLFGADTETMELGFIGFGTYAGDEIPDEEARGMAAFCRMNGRTNPKILLEDGSIVWGGECWWGTAEEVQSVIETYTGRGFRLVRKPIAEWRRLSRAREVQA